MDIVRFLNRFKVKEEKGYKEDQDRIMKLHKEKEVLSYIEDVYEEKKDFLARVIFVHGDFKVGDSILFYDCHGLEKGEGVISQITIGSQENIEMQSESGEKGFLYFELGKGEKNDIFSSQYISKK